MLDKEVKPTVQDLEVQRLNPGYVVSGQVRLRAPLEVVRRRLLDFNHLSRLHRSVQSSELQCSFSDGRHRVQIQIQFHIILRQFTLQSIQDFTWNEHTIHAIMLPGENGFASGELRWDLTPVNGDTQLHFRVELVPAFWVPPMIGPYLLKRILPEHAREIAQNLESSDTP